MCTWFPYTLLQLATICIQNMSSRRKSNSFVVDSDTALPAEQRVTLLIKDIKGFFLSPSISQVCHQADAYRTLLVRHMHASGLARFLWTNISQELKNTYWPWGAGMFATSLGPRFLDHGQLNLFECVVQRFKGNLEVLFNVWKYFVCLFTMVTNQWWAEFYGTDDWFQSVFSGWCHQSFWKEMFQ